MTTDESDNGWDSLAEEFGLQPAEPAPRAEKPEPARPAARPGPARPARESRVEVEEEADEFGAGVAPPPRHAALYDPGPDQVADEAEEFDDSAPEAVEVLGEDEGSPEAVEVVGEEEESPPTAEGEGGKRRRRRRRRRKKGGGGAESESAEGEPAADAEEETVVEEGEAPAEVEPGEDEEPSMPTAIDEELEEETAGPQPEWHVMTWMELVSRLYRPN